MLSAVIGKHSDMVALLLEHGVNVNKGDNEGETPLMLAAGSGNQELVVSLLSKGADKKAKDAEGRTAQKHAELAGHTEIAKLLE
jgi:ankyrin repeat protein